MSSPMIGRLPGLELLRPGRVAGDEDRHVVDERDPGFEGALGIELGRLLGPDRQVVQEDLGARALQDPHHVVGARLGAVALDEREVVLVAAHVFRDPVQNTSHRHLDASGRHRRGEDRGAVWSRKDGLVHVDADLSLVDVEGGHDLDVRGGVPTDLPVHQANRLIGRLGLVVLNPLQQRARAVADSNHCDLDLIHGVSPVVEIRPAREGTKSYGSRQAKERPFCCMPGISASVPAHAPQPKARFVRRPSSSRSRGPGIFTGTILRHPRTLKNSLGT